MWHLPKVGLSSIFLIFSTVLFMAGCESSNTESVDPAESESSPSAAAVTTNVYFGDTHLHTSLSMDAGTIGNRLGIDEAYRFTKGEEVTTSTGYKARRGGPLDWVVVDDHADGMGFFDMIRTGDPSVMGVEEGRRWHNAIMDGGDAALGAAMEIINTFSQGTFPFATNDPEMNG